MSAGVFSPDGKLLATAGADRTVRLWELARYVGPVRSLWEQTGVFTPGEQATYAEGEP